MAYLGKGLKSISTANITVDKMTGNGSATTMGISLGNQISGSVNDINVYISGVQQRPGTDYTLSGSTITFTTAPANGWPVVAISKGDSIKDDVIDSSVTSESIKDGAVTDAKIASVAASKLTGALPALDASALTGIVAYTKSASNPTVSTNPTGGTGTLWVNQSSGSVYVCTDATAGENVWTNIGAGTGDVEPYTFQGAVSGYSSGGDSTGSTFWNTIDKFEFASNVTASDHGDLSVTRSGTSGQNSNTHGYTTGGITLPGYVKSNVIDKFSFTSNVTADDHGDLTVARSGSAGQSSGTHGFASGGHKGSNTNEIDKFAVASNVTASDHGDISVSRAIVAGQSSSSHGYCSGGDAGGVSNVVDKFAFTSNVTSSDHGDITVSRFHISGQSSTTHGYSSGGWTSTYVNTIDKFDFASNVTASDHGDLQSARGYLTGQSSTTHGFTTGGWTSGVVNTIGKFAFASNVTGSDHGDLIQARYSLAGHQY